MLVTFVRQTASGILSKKLLLSQIIASERDIRECCAWKPRELWICHLAVYLVLFEDMVKQTSLHVSYLWIL